MRRVAACLAVVALAAGPARATERLDAEMLLDLDLLREDPARYRDQGLAERIRVLEILRMLETPPAPATPPPADAEVKRP
jgi:hypothetical protein